MVGEGRDLSDSICVRKEKSKSAFEAANANAGEQKKMAETGRNVEINNTNLWLKTTSMRSCQRQAQLFSTSSSTDRHTHTRYTQNATRDKN